MRQAIFNEIEKERAYQECKWGQRLDDTHTPADWWTFVTLYYTRALVAWKMNKADPTGYDRLLLRYGLIKVAAIVVAWIESLDRVLAVTTEEG